MNRRALAAGLLVACVAAAAVVASPAALSARLAWLAADPLRLAAALCLLAAVRPFLAWPTTLLAVVAGYGFGLAGAPFALVLITATSLPPYLLARRGRDGWGAGRLSALATRAAGAGERAVAVAGGFRSVAAARLLPTPSDAVNVGAGLAGVRLAPFLAGTTVGEVPWAVAGTVAGASAGRVAGGGLSAAFDPRLVAAAAISGLLLLVGPLYRQYASRSRSPPASDAESDPDADADPDG